jgi:hypothetical protein
MRWCVSVSVKSTSTSLRYPSKNFIPTICVSCVIAGGANLSNVELQCRTNQSRVYFGEEEFETLNEGSRAGRLKISLLVQKFLHCAYEYVMTKSDVGNPYHTGMNGFYLRSTSCHIIQYDVAIYLAVLWPSIIPKDFFHLGSLFRENVTWDLRPVSDVCFSPTPTTTVSQDVRHASAVDLIHVRSTRCKKTLNYLAFFNTHVIYTCNI